MNSRPQQGVFSFDQPDAVERQKDVPPFGASLLALNKVKGLGRKSLQALVRIFGDELGSVFAASQEEITSILQDAKTPGAETIAESVTSSKSDLISLGRAEVYSLASKRIYVIGPSDLPEAFREIPDGPPWLFVQGNKNILYDGPFVAVVGTRKPTRQGKNATKVVVRQLAAYDITLVSGLAEGIDEEAHATSLGEGVANVAFLGHGINFSIPATTKGLRAEIIKNKGAVVTEYLPDEHFQKSYFVQRNRLQAALADLVLPIEANPTGGTAHTVKFAQKYGRELMGIWWEGANGILEELRRNGYAWVDILSASGHKTLDDIFRSLAESAGHDTYALSLIERPVMNEIKRRNIRPEDLDEFITFLERFKNNQY